MMKPAAKLIGTTKCAAGSAERMLQSISALARKKQIAMTTTTGVSQRAATQRARTQASMTPSHYWRWLHMITLKSRALQPSVVSLVTTIQQSSGATRSTRLPKMIWPLEVKLGLSWYPLARGKSTSTGAKTLPTMLRVIWCKKCELKGTKQSVETTVSMCLSECEAGSTPSGSVTNCTKVSSHLHPTNCDQFVPPLSDLELKLIVRCWTS